MRTPTPQDQAARRRRGRLAVARARGLHRARVPTDAGPCVAAGKALHRTRAAGLLRLAGRHAGDRRIATDPTCVIVMIGDNDNQSLQTPTGETAAEIGSTEWPAGYEERVEQFTRIAVDGGAHVAWVGLPIVDRKERWQVMQRQNEIFERVVDRTPERGVRGHVGPIRDARWRVHRLLPTRWTRGARPGHRRPALQPARVRAGGAGRDGRPGGGVRPQPEGRGLARPRASVPADLFRPGSTPRAAPRARRPRRPRRTPPRAAGRAGSRRRPACRSARDRTG